MAVLCEIDVDRPDRIHVGCSYRQREKVKAIPGSKWDEDLRRWTVPLTWVACLALRTEFGSELSLGPNLRAWAAAIKPVKDALAYLRMQMSLPPGYESFQKILSPYGLLPHQEVDAVMMALSGRFLLLNETGTGKTYSALGALKILAEMCDGGISAIFPVLITCPKSVMRVWRNEIVKFFPDEEAVSVVDGTPTQTAKAIAPGSDFYIISWASMRKWSRHAPYGNVSIKPEDRKPKELQHLGLKTHIADEVHRAQNCESMQTRATWYTAWGCGYRFGMTGTLIQDSIEDMYGPLHLILPDEYASKTKYMDRWADYGYGDYGERVVNGFRADREDEFRANFNTITRIVTSDMALNLPPPEPEERWVTLPSKLRKIYNEMKKNYVAELTDGSVAATENQLTRANMLIRLANAELETVSVDEETGKPTYRYVSSPKVEAFLTDFHEGDFDGSQIVVFSDMLGVLDILEEKLNKGKGVVPYVRIDGSVTGDDRQKAIDTFQAGDARICMLTRAGGEGITLTAADTMVRLVRSWSYIVHTQVAARVRRIGSEKHDRIRYVDYMTEETLEEDQMIRILTKGMTATEALRTDELLEMLGR